MKIEEEKKSLFTKSDFSDLFHVEPTPVKIS